MTRGTWCARPTTKCGTTLSNRTYMLWQNRPNTMRIVSCHSWVSRTGFLGKCHHTRANLHIRFDLWRTFKCEQEAARNEVDSNSARKTPKLPRRLSSAIRGRPLFFCARANWRLYAIAAARYVRLQWNLPSGLVRICITLTRFLFVCGDVAGKDNAVRRFYLPNKLRNCTIYGPWSAACTNSMVK